MMILHDFWRSSAAYRTRIALNLKGLDYRAVAHHLPAGAQRAPDYLALNPQGLVPALQLERGVLGQSLAVIEYLEEVQPTPPLLPIDAFDRATVRAMALTVACDVHPLNNLRVLQYLRGEFAADETAVTHWIHHWMALGFEALETQVEAHSRAGRFCFADSPTMADLCLVPQLYNARRFGCELAGYPRLLAIDAHCHTLEPFRRAAPEAQPDAPAEASRGE
jgi:maleylpyruvate isomerase